MPAIEVDDEVLAWLKEEADPFEEITPNAVLRRVAGLNSGKTTSFHAKANNIKQVRGGGQKTPQPAFREPILRILHEYGGSGERNRVLRKLEGVMGGQLTDHDRLTIQSGPVRWQKSAEWEVSVMRQEGLLEPRHLSAWGEWKLSAVGKKAASALIE